MVPCDCFLSPKIKTNLKGRRFTISVSLREPKAIPNIEFDNVRPGSGEPLAQVGEEDDNNANVDE